MTRNSIMGWGGLLIIIISMYVMTAYINDGDSSLYKDRKAIVIEKEIGGHKHKGRIKPDYLLRVKWLDNGMTSGKTINSNEYINTDIGDVKTYRVPIDNQYIDRLFFWMIFVCAVGVILLSMAITNATII